MDLQSIFSSSNTESDESHCASNQAVKKSSFAVINIQNSEVAIPDAKLLLTVPGPLHDFYEVLRITYPVIKNVLEREITIPLSALTKLVKAALPLLPQWAIAAQKCAKASYAMYFVLLELANTVHDFSSIITYVYQTSLDTGVLYLQKGLPSTSELCDSLIKVAPSAGNYPQIKIPYTHATLGNFLQPLLDSRPSVSKNTPNNQKKRRKNKKVVTSKQQTSPTPTNKPKVDSSAVPTLPLQNTQENLSPLSKLTQGIFRRPKLASIENGDYGEPLKMGQ